MNRNEVFEHIEQRRRASLERAKKDTANNPINSYTHGFADGYSKGFIDAIELLYEGIDTDKDEVLQVIKKARQGIFLKEGE